MEVTIKTLKDLGACDEALVLARKSKRLMNGGLSHAAFVKAIPRADWLIWWLWNSKQATIEQIILLGLTAGRRSLRFARKEDRAVLQAAYDAAERAIDDNTEQNRSAARSASSAAWSASSAEWSASSAEWSASSAASSAAESAARSARSAARSAWSAARSAWSAARSAARSAEWSAEPAAWSAEQKAAADELRALMRTERYKRIGEKGAII